MLFRKLERVWSHNDMNYIPKFRETFPELNKISSEEMRDRWVSLGVDFYTEKQTNISLWIRLTLPFAIILMILMFVLAPFRFVLTGMWGYNLGQKNLIINWFRALHLM